MPRQMSRTNNTVLVAGGAGFLGSHLCEALLNHGHRVICVDSYLTGSPKNVRPFREDPLFTMVEADICDDFEIDGPLHQVFNLACPASPPQYQDDPVHTMMTNVVGTNRLLELASRHAATFLQASTSEVYGDPEEHPQQEQYWGNVNCTGPRACYDEGKRSAETLCFDWKRSRNLDVRVARIFNTYGPRMKPEDGRIVSNFIVQALQGEPLTVYGDGRQSRSFCYVSDLVEGLIRLMNLPENPGVPVNLGNPTEFNVAELALLIQETAGTHLPVTLEPLPEDDPKRRRPDISRARDLLGWQPQVPIWEGLELTIDWFRQNMPRTADRATQPVPAATSQEERPAV
jgi:UDP-glucuronate decarboxylase